METLKQILQEYKNGYYNEYDLNGLTLKEYREFTTWLVENDKINFEGMSGHGKIISYLTDEKDYKWNDIKKGVVLMLLSIQDKPIDFLVSILK